MVELFDSKHTRDYLFYTQSATPHVEFHVEPHVEPAWEDSPLSELGVLLRSFHESNHSSRHVM